MKKLLFITIILFCCCSAKAIEPVGITKKATEVYSTKTLTNGKRVRAQLFYLYVNDEIAYCIEPGVVLHDIPYQSSMDFESFGISDDIREELERIAYYGYDYENHQNLYYYMATQQLIWEKMGSQNIVWDTASNDLPNIDDYKKEILRLMEKHNVFPSFAESTISVKVGEPYKLVDQNGVLDDFEGDGIKIENNTIIFDSSEEVTKTYTLHQKRRKSVSFAYFANSSQSLATFGLSNPQQKHFSFSVKFLKEKGRIILTKKDGSTQLPLEGATFILYDQNHVLLEKKVSSSNGVITWDNLPYGKYFIKEESAPKGYVLLDEEIEVHLSQKEKQIITCNQPTQMPITSNIDSKYERLALSFFGAGCILLYVFKKIFKS